MIKILIILAVIFIALLFLYVFRRIRIHLIMKKLQKKIDTDIFRAICGSPRTSSGEDCYSFRKTALMTDYALRKNAEFEKAIRLSREGHDLSVLMESQIARLSETDAEVKRQYEEFKASSAYIPPEVRLKRPRFWCDEQRPSLSEDKPDEA